MRKKEKERADVKKLGDSLARAAFSMRLFIRARGVIVRIFLAGGTLL